jgi:tetratricopeptide (TPR) repeat protein
MVKAGSRAPEGRRALTNRPTGSIIEIVERVMVNYFEVLGIGQNSTTQEIKKSFRKRAKEIHPDLSPSDKSVSEERMRLLLTAYEVLSDIEKRVEYDRLLRSFLTSRGFDYREFLRARDDPRSQSRLIFHDLLTNHQDEALSLYETLTYSRGFALEEYLSREDFMDCTFLLAEVLEAKCRYGEAYEMYKKLYLLEVEKPYFHHFADEIIERLRTIICFKMVLTLPPRDSIGYLKELIGFGISRKDTAFFYKKLAELYSSLGQTEAAVKCLRKGLQLDRKLSGVKKLMERLGYPVCLDNP